MFFLELEYQMNRIFKALAQVSLATALAVTIVILFADLQLPLGVTITGFYTIPILISLMSDRLLWLETCKLSLLINVTIIKLYRQIIVDIKLADIYVSLVITQTSTNTCIADLLNFSNGMP